MGERKSEVEFTPTPSEIQEAREAADVLGRHEGEDVKVVISGESDVVLRAGSVRLLRNILTEAGAGKSIMLVPKDRLLSTQEAAEFLGVSRPFVTGLMREGKLAFVKVGTHRRVRFDDLAGYHKQMRAESGKAMEELVREGQELGWGRKGNRGNKKIPRASRD